MTASLWLFPSLAMAQATNPPDVMNLEDGTFLRGTIVERNAERVVFMLPTGEVRTYPMDEVRSVGPVSASLEPQPVAPVPMASEPATPEPATPEPATPEPAAPPAPVAPQPPASEGVAPPLSPYDDADASNETARIRVVTDQEGLSLQRMSGSGTLSVMGGGALGTARVDTFDVMCNAPCDMDVEPGTYQFGVAQGDGSALRAGAPIDLLSDTTLSIAFDDRSRLRVGGWFIYAAGAGGGAALVMGGVLQGPGIIDVPLLVTGIVIALAGSITGLVLAFLGDVASVDVIDAEGVHF